MTLSILIIILLALKWITVAIRDRTYYSNKITWSMLGLDILMVIACIVYR